MQNNPIPKKSLGQPGGNVYTPELSYIYTLQTNKKDLDEVNFSNMVELPDTASGSAGLSWLCFYRRSPF